MAQGEMTAEEFEALRPRFARFASESVEYARLVLVDGQDQSEVARLHGVQRQIVNRPVTKIRALAADAPKGWQRVEQYFPPAVATALNAYAVELRAAEADGAEILAVAAPDLHYALVKEIRDAQ